MKNTQNILCLLFLCYSMTSFADDAKKIVVSDFWIRPVIGKRSMTSAYLKIKNITDQPIYLSEVLCDNVKNVEIHKTVVENNIARMIKIDKLAIPANTEVEMKPGSIHLMLNDINKKMEIGEVINMEFVFENGNKLLATAEVKRG